MCSVQSAGSKEYNLKILAFSLLCNGTFMVDVMRNANKKNEWSNIYTDVFILTPRPSPPPLNVLGVGSNGAASYNEWVDMRFIYEQKK